MPITLYSSWPAINCILPWLIKLLMRAVIFTFALLVVTLASQAQESYETTLDLRLKQITSSEIFNNSVVVLDESSGYGATLPSWDPNTDYYQDDVTLVKGRMFRALVDSKGKNPESSPNEWMAIRWPRPYLFLRDTATTKDLRKLLTADHPFIRVYAFAALNHRKEPGLFKFVLQNLKDTTYFTQMTSDYGYAVCAADMMLSYSLPSFTEEQKDTLKRLILTEYNHLKSLDDVLLFHSPSTHDYPYVKSIVDKDPKNKFALVALSKYCKPEDIKKIEKGFDPDPYDVYFHGIKVFYNAIENCPHKYFKSKLIAKKDEEFHVDRWLDESYISALASYKNKDCLMIISDFAKRKSQFKSENLAIIYRSLKKHYCPLYDPLISEIKINNVSDHHLMGLSLSGVNESPWNY